MNKIDTLLFDFDGTLADTFPIIFHAFQGVFKEFKNQHITGKEIVSMFGPAENEIIRRHFAECDDTTRIIERYYELYDGHHNALVPCSPAIIQMLLDFKACGYKLGIVTGKGRRSLDISLNHLYPKTIFDVTIAGDEVTIPKPHPQGLLKALERLDSTVDRTVYIGDSEFDVKAGKAAGMKTIGVKWFGESEIEWGDESPHMTIINPNDLKNLAIKRLFQGF